jgi:hypothetical protein
MTVGTFGELNMNFVRLDEGRVTELCNPITRSWAKLSPPFEPDLAGQGMDELAQLQHKFAKFCEDCWTAAPWRRDPHLVNPHAIMDGTEQVHPLDTVIDNLISEYGFWLVAAEIEKRRPQ